MDNSSNSVSSAGRLHFFKTEWQKFTSDQTILEIVEGYKLSFKTTPIQLQIPKNKAMSNEEITQMDVLISKLLATGAILETVPMDGQYISPVFLVPKPNGSFRFILNLKTLNQYIWNSPFKMEDFRTAKRLILPGDFMATLDLQDAYHLISVYKSHRKFLRFQWNKKLYEFQCLPFGLSTAPRIFTKVMRCVVGFLRRRGLSSVLYLDDLLLIGNSLAECNKNIHDTVSLLESLGFLINFKKSVLIPSVQCKFLGFIYNSSTMRMNLPKSKVTKACTLCQSIRIKSLVTIQEFSEFLGFITSLCPAVPYGPLYTKQLERAKYLALLAHHGSYKGTFLLKSEVINDILWWERVLPVNLGISFQETPFDTEIFSDASKSGWGAWSGVLKTHGWWNAEEAAQSINLLELKATYYAIRCFAHGYTNSRILLRIDNTTAISYVNRMGGVQFPKYNEIARAIWQYCESRNITLFASYIKSKDNVQADTESRKLDYHSEWELGSEFFKEIVKLFGQPEIDLFATFRNSKCDRFVSWRPDPYAENIDAFTLCWSNLVFYAFPPFSMILRVLQKISMDKAAGVLVVPYWPNQPWFPLYLSLLVKPMLVFKPNKNLLSFLGRPHTLHPHLSLAAGFLSRKH